eukprot:9255329-Pyramimonas_sp.AAC.1
MRCAQFLFFPAAEGGGPRARSELYVDDPNTSIRGDAASRDRTVSVFVLALQTLGFPLAFRKVQRGTSVSWIGCDFVVALDK